MNCVSLRLAEGMGDMTAGTSSQGSFQLGLKWMASKDALDSNARWTPGLRGWRTPASSSGFWGGTFSAPVRMGLEA